MAEILERLVAPAALVAWLLATIVAIAWRKGWRRLSVLSGLSLAAYLALSTPLGANLLLHAMEARADSLRDCRYSFDGSTLVVLGAGMEIDGVPKVDPGRLSRGTLRRVMVAASIARTGQVIRIVVTGRGAVVREADLMRDALAELGLSPAAILVESTSEDTLEQSRNVARMLDRYGARPHRVGLVTSATQMPRAYSVFSAENFEICPIIAEWRSARPPVRLALIPHISDLDKSTEALGEVAATLGAWLRGRPY